ncbi:hypothetical protein [Methylobacterium radiotolerans]|uniref:hypothetical protein n=1 Tax=Methylobacterium radiotolerans TaxID=31998 RepID=UPI001F32FB97|nr:hypothetical protein [Methylobacterium radiotolerans]UIY44111.1 hypothetical protein LZ599_10670 [Methylobacterium radiotolerans]
MVEFINPEMSLADIADFFEDVAAEGGVTLDEELCKAFAEAIQEAASSVRLLVERAVEAGLLERFPITEAPRRTAMERALLARMAVAVDPAGTVIAFPALRSTGA